MAAFCVSELEQFRNGFIETLGKDDCLHPGIVWDFQCYCKPFVGFVIMLLFFLILVQTTKEAIIVNWYWNVKVSQMLFACYINYVLKVWYKRSLLVSISLNHIQSQT